MIQAMTRRKMLALSAAFGAAAPFATSSLLAPRAAAQVATPTADSGEYTINGWGVTDADFAFFGISRDIELSADGWHTKDIADDPNVYEWWYFDIQSPDGTTITLTLSP
ncbi:MAG: hypothetical protein ACRDJC_21775, partial [Thermomicrobiales bacterium]